MNKPQVIDHIDHLPRVHPELHPKYKDMLEHMPRRSNSHYHCSVSLSAASDKVMTIGSLMKHENALQEHIGAVLDGLTESTFSLLYNHIDEPITKAIALLESDRGDTLDDTYRNNVIKELKSLYSYHRPFKA